MPLHNPYAELDGPHIAARVMLSPVYLLWAGYGFVIGWFQSRQMRWLLQGLPAVGVILLLTSVFALGQGTTGADAIRRFKDKARIAATDEDYARAEFYFRKLDNAKVTIDDDAELRYLKALVEEGHGRLQNAAQLMLTVVDDDPDADSLEARVWIAEHLLGGTLSLGRNDGRICLDCLQRVLAIDESNFRAHQLMAKLAIQSHDAPLAVKHLNEIVDRQPGSAFLLAELYTRMGDEPKAVASAKRAAEYYETQVEELQSNDADVWARWARSLAMAGEFEASIAVLERATGRIEERARMHLAARTLFLWSDHIRDHGGGDLSDRIKLLEQAVLLAPGDPEVMGRLAILASKEFADSETARRLLEPLLADGTAPGVVHLILGAQAANVGDVDRAVMHLDQANNLSPGTPVTLNNLAYSLARSSRPDLEKALEMADQAVRLAPQVHTFRETRGQIYMLMKRWKEAIADLEFALTGMQDDASIHRALAVAYDAIGQPALADLHRQRLSGIESAASR